MFTLGVVPYLNALPLYRTLESSGQAHILRAVPALLTARLAAGECDAAIIPIVDHLRGAGAHLVSTACIGSSGPVRSVLMFSKVPIEHIQSVAVDASSHTSVALLRIVLADAYDLHPPFIDHAPDLSAMLRSHDACLLIGDNALEAALIAPAQNINILDLGEAWTQKVAHQPFVYAAWVTRQDLSEGETAQLGQLLDAARDEGTRDIAAIVRHSPITTKLNAAQIEDYLGHSIQFHLTAAHQSGLTEFRRRCIEHGLVNDNH